VSDKKIIKEKISLFFKKENFTAEIRKNNITNEKR